MKKMRAQWYVRQGKIGKRRWKNAISRKGRGRLYSQRIKSDVEQVIIAPQTLSFRKDYSRTVSFLQTLRKAAPISNRRRERLYVDLKPISYISVPAAIVLAAEFHRWKIVSGRRLNARDSEKWHPLVRNLLADLGVFDLLSIKKVPGELNDVQDNITLTRLESGLQTEPQKLGKLQERFSYVLNTFTAKPDMFGGLMEAVENAIHHAYPNDYAVEFGSVGKRWWAASCLDPRTMSLRFFVFDQGAGIPRTLPRSGIWLGVVERLSVLTGGLLAGDAAMIKAAMEEGQTRTGLSHRGHGLKRMMDIVQGNRAAYMRILSSKGEIVYHFDGRMETVSHSESMSGTLIEWNIEASAFYETQAGSENENH